MRALRAQLHDGAAAAGRQRIRNHEILGAGRSPASNPTSPLSTEAEAFHTAPSLRIHAPLMTQTDCLLSLSFLSL